MKTIILTLTLPIYERSIISLVKKIGMFCPRATKTHSLNLYKTMLLKYKKGLLPKATTLV